MKIRVYGRPVPQGSARAFVVRRGGAPTGRAVVTGDNTKTRPWKESIVAEAVAAMGTDWAAQWAGQNGAPLAVKLTFIMSRPGTHYGKGRNAAVVRPSAPPLPTTKPDLDKLCRAVLDALTDAKVWHDDAQVAHLDAFKIWEAPGAGIRPGVVIEVAPLGDVPGHG